VFKLIDRFVRLENPIYLFFTFLHFMVFKLSTIFKIYCIIIYLYFTKAQFYVHYKIGK